MIKNILAIEDDRFIGEMYVRNLRNEGFDVDWAIDGNDGLVMARNKKYDPSTNTNGGMLQILIMN
jgi:DNA-binding response OmpR family regulator